MDITFLPTLVGKIIGYGCYAAIIVAAAVVAWTLGEMICKAAHYYYLVCTSQLSQSRQQSLPQQSGPLQKSCKTLQTSSEKPSIHTYMRFLDSPEGKAWQAKEAAKLGVNLEVTKGTVVPSKDRK